VWPSGRMLWGILAISRGAAQPILEGGDAHEEILGGWISAMGGVWQLAAPWVYRLSGRGEVGRIVSSHPSPRPLSRRSGPSPRLPYPPLRRDYHATTGRTSPASIKHDRCTCDQGGSAETRWRGVKGNTPLSQGGFSGVQSATIRTPFGKVQLSGNEWPSVRFS